MIDSGLRIALLSLQEQQSGGYLTAFPLANGCFGALQVFNKRKQKWEEVDYVFSPHAGNPDEVDDA